MESLRATRPEATIRARMADTRTLLDIQPREERGSRANRRLRREGLVPGVVYGGNGDPEAFKVDGHHLRAVLAEGHALFDVETGSGRQPVVVKDQDRDEVRGFTRHIDLLRVRLDQKIQSPVVIELVGGDDAPGVKEGGVLSQVTREVIVEALPTDIPDGIKVDVSGLGIAETMTLASVQAPAGSTFIDDLEETVVATITAPTKVEEPEIEEEAELVGEEGEVPEGEEGEAAAEAAEGGEESSEGGSEE
jgi:large subunit ribosomal protein L25